MSACAKRPCPLDGAINRHAIIRRRPRPQVHVQKVRLPCESTQPSSRDGQGPPPLNSKGGAPPRIWTFLSRLSGFLAYLDDDAGDGLVVDGDVAGDRPQGLVPDLERVLAGRHVVESELAVGAGEGEERVPGDHHPGPHPGVEIAVDPDDLRLLAGDGY